MAPVLLAISCAGRSPQPLAALEPEPLEVDRSLRVRLLFGPEADLDLHVTDPKSETVYFGNSPSRGGGVLSGDVRCDAPAPRIEVVTFVKPETGRYRVGVDFAGSCKKVRDAVPFQIEVLGPHGRQQIDGTVERGRFEHIALEFELED